MSYGDLPCVRDVSGYPQRTRVSTKSAWRAKLHIYSVVCSMVRHALSSRAASKIVHDFNHPYLLGQQPYKSDKTASRALLCADSGCRNSHHSQTATHISALTNLAWCDTAVVDQDHSCEMESEEGMRFLEAAGCAPAELEYYWDDLVSIADANGDGGIQKQEFISYMIEHDDLQMDGEFADPEREKMLREAIRMLGGATELVSQLFDSVDTDMSGHLDENEGKYFLSVLGTEVEHLVRHHCTCTAPYRGLLDCAWITSSTVFLYGRAGLLLARFGSRGRQGPKRQDREERVPRLCDGASSSCTLPLRLRVAKRKIERIEFLMSRLQTTLCSCADQ